MKNEGVIGSKLDKREVRKNRGEDSKLDYQVRVTVNWMEKFKSVGAGALNSVEGFRGCTEDRVILADVANVGVIKGVNQRTSNSPVKVISSDIRTLRDRDGNRRGVVRVFRHTLGRRYSCQG